MSAQTQHYVLEVTYRKPSSKMYLFNTWLVRIQIKQFTGSMFIWHRLHTAVTCKNYLATNFAQVHNLAQFMVNNMTEKIITLAIKFKKDQSS